MNWPHSHCKIEVSLDRQEIVLVRNEKEIFKASVSTAANGPGVEEGSYRTPIGNFVVRERIGEGAPIFTNFKGRIPRNVWKGEQSEDAVLSRILWLEGLDENNANTYCRYIYFHGTHAEELIGSPASHGCIRLINEQMLTLFNLTPIGTKVLIF
ncbi:MAG: L,D-transpeptidase [Akkermansiaceae bacterium]